MLFTPHGLPVAAGFTMPFVLFFFSTEFVVVFLTSLNDRACAVGQRIVPTMLPKQRTYCVRERHIAVAVAVVGGARCTMRHYTNGNICARMEVTV